MKMFINLYVWLVWTKMHLFDKGAVKTCGTEVKLARNQLGEASPTKETRVQQKQA